MYFKAHDMQRVLWNVQGKNLGERCCEHKGTWRTEKAERTRGNVCGTRFIDLNVLSYMGR